MEYQNNLLAAIDLGFRHAMLIAAYLDRKVKREFNTKEVRKIIKSSSYIAKNVMKDLQAAGLGRFHHGGPGPGNGAKFVFVYRTRDILSS